MLVFEALPRRGRLRSLRADQAMAVQDAGHGARCGHRVGAVDRVKRLLLRGSNSNFGLAVDSRLRMEVDCA